MNLDDIKEFVRMTGDRQIPLLVDETYREMSFHGVLPYAATLADHVISVASFSKTYGLPGIRLGWLMTQNTKMFERFFAAKEQIQICGSALDEEIGFQFYQKRDQYLPPILANLKRRYEIVCEWMKGPQGNGLEHLEWIQPS